MRARPIFAWYDLWVGIFIDIKGRKVYIFPIPMIGIIISWSPQMRLYHFTDDIESLWVAATDADDAFKVIEELWGADAADTLVLSKLTDKGLTATERGLISHKVR